MEMEPVLDSQYSNFPEESETEVKKGSEYDADSEKRRQKMYIWLCGILTLIPLVLVILTLFALPTVLYASQKNTAAVTECSQVKNYSGVCRETLTSQQVCFSGATSSPTTLIIPASIDQESNERKALQLLNGLTHLAPSEECLEAVKPFLCLTLFPFCDSDNGLNTISRKDCTSLRDDICEYVWKQATHFLGHGVLPICEKLPDISKECNENSTSVSPSTPIFYADIVNNSLDGQPHVCAKHFFRDENSSSSICIPVCGAFSLFKPGVRVLNKVAVCVSFVSSMVMLVIALTIQRKKLLVFPVIIPFYLCTSIFVLSTLIILGFFDISTFYCSSKDLVAVVQEGGETAYCILVGAVFNYCLLQLAVWLVLQAVFMFWSVAYPFGFRQLKVSGKIRYAHIASIVAALLIPLPSAFVHLSGGNLYITSSVLPCMGRNTDYIYYTFILPMSILEVGGMILLVLIIWTIFKEFVLKKLLAKKKASNVGAAELKITAILITNMGLSVTGLVTYTLADTEVITEGRVFAFCEASGGPNCDLGGVDTFNITVPVTFALLSLLPMVAILLSCDIQAFKKAIKSLRSGTKTSSFKN